MIASIDYASPSVFLSNREQAMLGMSACARRPVRFHGRVRRQVPLLRFTLRALGEAIWSNDTWTRGDDVAGGCLDPIITVHPDRIFLEAFSQDQSAYVMAILNPDMFETEGEVVTGTTHIDFTAWLWGALSEMRSSRDTWLRIGAEGFELVTRQAGGRFERIVDMPDPWVRSFLQVSSAMAMPGTRLQAKPSDLLAAIRFLRHTKSKLSPRALRYEMVPGEDARILLEPWEQAFPLRGAEHPHAETRTIRTWGRRRLKLIEPLLPFATSVEIFLKGRGLPSFYAVTLPDLTFVLGLSGWTGQAWSGGARFDLLSQPTAPDETLMERVESLLAERVHATTAQLAEALQQPRESVHRACERLGRRGRVMYDVVTREFRHRVLFEHPVDEAKLFPPDERLERAEALLARDAIPFARCEPQETRKVRRLKTPDGPVMREIIFRDWRVSGQVAEDKAEIVVGDAGRILFGTCSCPFFQEHLLGQGPCEHMIALFRATAEERKELPTSGPASSELGMRGMPDEGGGEEGFDGDDDDEENDDR